MSKRGQFEISFSMIFSIIIIIAIIGISFYVINHFLTLSKCTKIGVFYEGLQENIEKAWQAQTCNSDICYKNTFKGQLPSGIEEVCLGNVSQYSSRQYEKEYNALVGLNKKKENVFLYPPNKACDYSFSTLRLEHARSPEFFCIPVNNGEVEIKIQKGRYDSLASMVK